MTGKTHLVGGVASCVLVANFTEYDPLVLTAAGAVGSLIPDICHGGSKIGRRFPLLSKIVNVLFGHRTFTHSLLFLALTSILIVALSDSSAILIGYIVGVVSHLILDAATKNGIQLLYPFKLTVRLPLTTRTGGAVEYIVLAGLSLVAIYYGKDILFNYI